MYNGSTMTLRVNGDIALVDWYLYCNVSDRCIIICGSSQACTMLGGYCFGQCSIDCDQLNGIDCPTNLNGSIEYITPSPTYVPTVNPTFEPTNIPSFEPTYPSQQPSFIPSSIPTTFPSIIPSVSPTRVPSNIPTQPTIIPTNIPTIVPTSIPTTNAPTIDHESNYSNVTQAVSMSMSTGDISNVLNTTIDVHVDSQQNSEDELVMVYVVASICGLIIIIVLIVFLYLGKKQSGNGHGKDIHGHPVINIRAVNSISQEQLSHIQVSQLYHQQQLAMQFNQQNRQNEQDDYEQNEKNQQNLQNLANDNEFMMNMNEESKSASHDSLYDAVNTKKLHERDKAGKIEKDNDDDSAEELYKQNINVKQSPQDSQGADVTTVNPTDDCHVTDSDDTEDQMEGDIINPQ